METIIGNQPMNSAQFFVYQTLAKAKSEEVKEELTSLYLNYLQKKLNDETKRLWMEGIISHEKIEEILNSHYRIPYK